MNKETNKIINWIEMGYTRLNYKEELLLVNYIKQLQQENKHLKEHIEKYEHYCKTTGIEELRKENKKYKEVIDKIKEEIKKELKENNHISYGVALSIIVTLNYYEEILKGETNE